MSERLELVEFVEDSADYRSAKALRHENGYLEWKSEENNVTNLTHSMPHYCDVSHSNVV